MDIRPVDRSELTKRVKGKALPENPNNFSLLLPKRYVLQKQWEAMKAQGVDYATSRETAHRTAHNPIWGDVAVMPRDERQALVTDPGNRSTANPLMYVRHRPGRRPIVAIGMGASPWQELKEMVDEEDHYNPELPEKQYRVDWNDIWHAQVEHWRDQAKGKIVTGGGRPTG